MPRNSAMTVSLSVVSSNVPSIVQLVCPNNAASEVVVFDYLVPSSENSFHAMFRAQSFRA